jgi:hypothetical protein
MKINHQNIKEWLFRQVEGDLSIQEQRHLDKFLTENPAYRTELNYWMSTKIEPEEDIYDLELEESLLKPIPNTLLPKNSVSTHKNWIFASLGMIIGASLVYFFMKTDDNPVKIIQIENPRDEFQSSPKSIKTDEYFEKDKHSSSSNKIKTDNRVIEVISGKNNAIQNTENQDAKPDFNPQINFTESPKNETVNPSSSMSEKQDINLLPKAETSTADTQTTQTPNTKKKNSFKFERAEKFRTDNGDF